MHHLNRFGDKIYEHAKKNLILKYTIMTENIRSWLKVNYLLFESIRSSEIFIVIKKLKLNDHQGVEYTILRAKSKGRVLSESL